MNPAHIRGGGEDRLRHPSARRQFFRAVSGQHDRQGQAGKQLGLLQMPSLVLWGMQDPYIPPSFASAYAQALPNSELVELADAGHWCWFDRPDAIGRAVEFLSAP